MTYNYYCLVASLPDITFEDGKLSYNVASFIEELSEQLAWNDKKVVELFRLQTDNSNLMAYLKDKEATLDPLGVFDALAFEQAVVAYKEEELYRGRLPRYMQRFIFAYLADSPIIEGLAWEDQLSGLYYQYAVKSSNRFASQWFELNLNIGNVLVAQAARKQGLDLQKVIIGNNDVANTIRTVGGRDFGLTGALDYFESLVRIAEEPNLYERERRVDLLKWKWLEDEVFFHYFSIERLFAYLLQLQMIERWLTLNKETGEQMFRSMIKQMKGSVDMPEEFR